MATATLATSLPYLPYLPYLPNRFYLPNLPHLPYQPYLPSYFFKTLGTEYKQCTLATDAGVLVRNSHLTPLSRLTPAISPCSVEAAVS
ncbi:MAG: hypothetical protein ACK55Z_36680 [bacterium]